MVLGCGGTSEWGVNVKNEEGGKRRKDGREKGWLFNKKETGEANERNSMVTMVEDGGRWWKMEDGWMGMEESCMKDVEEDDWMGGKEKKEKRCKEKIKGRYLPRFGHKVSEVCVQIWVRQRH